MASRKRINTADDGYGPSGSSEFRRRSAGVTGDALPEQYAERDRELESEHAQDPDEQGLAFLIRATQDEAAREQLEPEQSPFEHDVPSTGERYMREQVANTEITRQRLITRYSDQDEGRTARERAQDQAEEETMTVAKVTEITAESTESFDAAIRDGIAAASRSIENIRNVWIKDQQVIVRDNKPERYRVDMKVTFVLNDR